MHDAMLLVLGGVLGVIATGMLARSWSLGKCTEDLNGLTVALEDAEDRIAEAEAHLDRLADRQQGLSRALASSERALVDRIIRKVIARRLD